MGQPCQLDGLTFAVKDNIDIANEITGYGSPGWAATHSKSTANAICIEQLLSAGGTCLGKVKLDELAYSVMGINPFYGAPLNPKAPDRVPGGSSSGSASAVASQLVDFAIGTDTGGSIRVPASNCGIWGYRPSHGLISVSGVLPLAPSFDTVGVVAQTGETLKNVMSVLLAEDKENHKTFPSIGFIDDVFKISHEQIQEAIKPIRDKLSKFTNTRSLTFKDITDKQITCQQLFELSAHLMSVEIWNTFSSWIENDKPELSQEITYNFNNYAKMADRKNVQNNLCIKKLFSKKLNQFLCPGNILCFPTTADLAPKLNDVTTGFLSKGDYIPKSIGINAISGLSNIPQITMPIAESNGVPFGLSFVAGYGQDMMLVNFCNQLWSCIKNTHL